MPQIVMVDPRKTKPNPFQPEKRITPPEETVKRYALSIKEHGLKQTPLARMVGDAYEIADGWLRRCAFVYLIEQGEKSFEEMPVEICQYLDEDMADTVIEANEVRQDLNPIEKAQCYKRYMTEFHLSQVDFAKKRNVSQGEIANTLRLLELPEHIQMKVISREIPETLARSLLQLKKHVVQMNDMADRIAGGSMTRAALDEEIRQILGKPKPQPKIVNPPAPAAQAPTLDVTLVNAGIEKSPAGEVIDPAQIVYEKAIDEDSGFTASFEQSAELTPPSKLKRALAG